MKNQGTHVKPHAKTIAPPGRAFIWYRCPATMCTLASILAPLSPRKRCPRVSVGGDGAPFAFAGSSRLALEGVAMTEDSGTVGNVHFASPPPGGEGGAEGGLPPEGGAEDGELPLDGVEAPAPARKPPELEEWESVSVLAEPLSVLERRRAGKSELAAAAFS